MKKLYFFLKKELFESWRTSRCLILLIIFLIIGLMNPLLAKLLPEIIKQTIGEGLANTLAEPTSFDSWTQFYKNYPQTGLIVLALMFSGIVSNEINKGTLINLITKGLRRWTVIIGKLLSLVIQWTLCLTVTFLVTWFYTQYYFPDNQSPHPFQAVFPLWIFQLLLVGLILFTSTIARNNYEGLLLSGGLILLFILLSVVKKLKYLNPLSLVTQNLVFLQKDAVVSDYWPAMLLSVLLFVLFVSLSIAIFNQKKL